MKDTDDITATTLRDARAAVDKLAAALTSSHPQEHHRAVQAFKQALAELGELLAGPEEAAARNILSTAFRVARDHGLSAAEDSNPAPRTVIDVWALGDALKGFPDESLPPDLRALLLDALDALSEFDTERVRCMLRDNWRIPERELDELLRKLG